MHSRSHYHYKYPGVLFEHFLSLGIFKHAIQEEPSRLTLLVLQSCSLLQLVGVLSVFPELIGNCKLGEKQAPSHNSPSLELSNSEKSSGLLNRQYLIYKASRLHISVAFLYVLSTFQFLTNSPCQRRPSHVSSCFSQLGGCQHK